MFDVLPSATPAASLPSLPAKSLLDLIGSHTKFPAPPSLLDEVLWMFVVI